MGTAVPCGSDCKAQCAGTRQGHLQQGTQAACLSGSRQVTAAGITAVPHVFVASSRGAVHTPPEQTCPVGQHFVPHACAVGQQVAPVHVSVPALQQYCVQRKPGMAVNVEQRFL